VHDPAALDRSAFPRSALAGVAGLAPGIGPTGCAGSSAADTTEAASRGTPTARSRRNVLLA
jgi:hypothetical protein